MKSSTRENAEAKMIQMKGKFMEVVGKVFKNSPLKEENKDANLNGNVQEKTIQSKKVEDE